jgi:hypothetical protein
MKGFSSEWYNLIKQFIQGGLVVIQVNDDIGHYFQMRKGLRQGDPLSPLLFNIVADMLAILIARAKEDGQIGGLVPHFVEGVIRPICITILYHNLLLFIDIFHI